MSLDIRRFWCEQAEWSQRTFGADTIRGPIGALKHLEKEAREAQADLTNIEEFVDCLFLVFDATRRAGFTFDELVEAAFAKLEVNKSRRWPASKMDEPTEHEEEGRE